MLGRPVVYACPTQNLARQIARAAERVGLDFVTLVGRHRQWPTADKVRYESAAAVASTTYSTLFNGRPALEAPATVLFDDAHAAESYVAGSWSVEITRSERAQLYAQVLELIATQSTARFLASRDGHALLVSPGSMTRRSADRGSKTSSAIIPARATRADLEVRIVSPKSTLEHTAEAADRWTWLMIAAHTQLRLARPLAADLRRPWERPAPGPAHPPARVRRNVGTSARGPSSRPVHPKPSRPGLGLGRPPGSRN